MAAAKAPDQVSFREQAVAKLSQIPAKLQDNWQNRRVETIILSGIAVGGVILATTAIVAAVVVNPFFALALIGAVAAIGFSAYHSGDEPVSPQRHITHLQETEMTEKEPASEEVVAPAEAAAPARVDAAPPETVSPPERAPAKAEAPAEGKPGAPAPQQATAAVITTPASSLPEEAMTAVDLATEARANTVTRRRRLAFAAFGTIAVAATAALGVRGYRAGTFDSSIAAVSRGIERAAPYATALGSKLSELASATGTRLAPIVNAYQRSETRQEVSRQAVRSTVAASYAPYATKISSKVSELASAAGAVPVIRSLINGGQNATMAVTKRAGELTTKVRGYSLVPSLGNITSGEIAAAQAVQELTEAAPLVAEAAFVGITPSLEMNPEPFEHVSGALVE
jgi:hypothetical protein